MTSNRLLIATTVLFLYSCNKQDDQPFTTGNSYPGALDSCTLILPPGGFNSDSGVYVGNQFQTFRFSYDDQKRVVKMSHTDIGINIANVYTTFYYQGASTNAYMVKDSINTSTPSLTIHKLFYDNQNRVFLDSTHFYYHNTDGSINSSSLADYVKIYQYVPGYMTYTSTQYPFLNDIDTTFFNAQGDEIKNVFTRPFSSSGYIYDRYQYHNIESPFSKLNIKTAYEAFPGFYQFSISSGSIDQAHNKYLFKKIEGFRYFGNQPWERFNTVTNCYYATDAANRVDRMVLTNYEYKSNGPLNEVIISSIRFYYHE